MKDLMRDHYIKYASYVILDRAIPDLIDGLKPVQRRILYTLFRMNDGKFHKVANVTGQTMALHPHGDAPIYEALVALANKGFLFDCQGNFGNPFTGDPAAASRYIEARLSRLALEVCFNSKLTKMAPSYDGRQSEPVTLPVKIPLILLQGTEGIAVGMATKIVPHNFNEVLEAEIAFLRGNRVDIAPDFLSGGVCDASNYQAGKGKLRVRAKIEIKDQKTLVIRELPYGATTESVIASIEDAERKGKIKIDSIHDYTSQQIEIEIQLPRGVYAKEIEEQLYAFTECEVSLSPAMVVIQDGGPKEVTVHDVIEYHASCLKGYLKQELELELEEIGQKIFIRTLEEIFIEEKLYKALEEVDLYDEVFSVLDKGFAPFLHLLERPPLRADMEQLLAIPIRRIAKFDRAQNAKEKLALEKRRKAVASSLKNLTEHTIAFLQSLIDTYGAQFPRRTRLQVIEEVDKKEIEKKAIDVGVDLESGYMGTRVPSSFRIRCTNFDKMLIFYDDGSYKVVSVDEKEYIGKPSASIKSVGVADKATVFTCIYLDSTTKLSYCKRFVVKQFILNKEYRYFDEACRLLVLTSESSSYLVRLVPKLRQKMSAVQFDPASVLIKNVSAKGVRVASRPCLQVEAIR